MRQHAFRLLAVVMFVASAALAAAPTTRPVEEKAKELAAQLGDQDPDVRDQAVGELRKIGEDALPVLRETAKSGNAYAKLLAKTLIRELESPAAKPAAENRKAPAGYVPRGPGARGMQGGGMWGAGGGRFGGGGMGGRAGFGGAMGGGGFGGPGGVRSFVASENGRTVTVTETADSITLVISEPDADGKTQTRQYTAKNIEQLRKEQPKAAAIYDRLMKQQAAMAPRMMMPRGLEQMARPGEMPMPGMRLHLDTPNLIEFGADVEEAPEALRSQLGVGMVVTAVQAGSRAEKLGLKEHDFIQKAGDKPVEVVEDLEKAVSGTEVVVLEITRAGTTIKLEEKKAK